MHRFPQVRWFQLDEGVYSFLSDTRKASVRSDMVPGGMCHTFSQRDSPGSASNPECKYNYIVGVFPNIYFHKLVF